MVFLLNHALICSFLAFWLKQLFHIGGLVLGCSQSWTGPPRRQTEAPKTLNQFYLHSRSVKGTLASLFSPKTINSKIASQGISGLVDYPTLTLKEIIHQRRFSSFKNSMTNELCNPANHMSSKNHPKCIFFACNVFWIGAYLLKNKYFLFSYLL